MGKEIDRLWGISGGILDLVTVIIQMRPVAGGLLYDWLASEG
jgi:hypothetical protein